MDNIDITVLSNAKNLNLNKGELINVIKELVKVSNIARREGLLALEEYVNANLLNIGWQKFFKDAIMYIVDGTDPQYVRTILSNRLCVEGLTTESTYYKFLIMNGSLMVQQGFNPLIIKEMTLSCIPMAELEVDIARCFDEADEELTASKRLEYAKRWEELNTKDFEIVCIKAVEDIFEVLTDKEIQRVILDTEYKSMANVLMHCSQQIKNKVTDALPTPMRAQLGSWIDYCDRESMMQDLFDVLNKMQEMYDAGFIDFLHKAQGGLFSEEEINMLLSITEGNKDEE